PLQQCSSRANPPPERRNAVRLFLYKECNHAAPRHTGEQTVISQLSLAHSLPFSSKSNNKPTLPRHRPGRDPMNRLVSTALLCLWLSTAQAGQESLQYLHQLRSLGF